MLVFSDAYLRHIACSPSSQTAPLTGPTREDKKLDSATPTPTPVTAPATDRLARLGAIAGVASLLFAFHRGAVARVAA